MATNIIITAKTAPTLSGLTATTASSGGIQLSWNNPNSASHDSTVIYSASTNDFTAATAIATTRDFVYVDAVDPGLTKYYWIKSKTPGGLINGAVHPATTSGTVTGIPATVANLYGWTSPSGATSTNAGSAASASTDNSVIRLSNADFSSISSNAIITEIIAQAGGWITSGSSNLTYGVRLSWANDSVYTPSSTSASYLSQELTSYGTTGSTKTTLSGTPTTRWGSRYNWSTGSVVHTPINADDVKESAFGMIIEIKTGVTWGTPASSYPARLYNCKIYVSWINYNGVSGTSSSTVLLPSTNTPAGTTGNQTINNASGRVNIAAAGTSVTVTNNLVTANSHVFAQVSKNDTTAYIKSVTPAAGSFVIRLGAAATAETSVDFVVFNPQ